MSEAADAGWRDVTVPMEAVVQKAWRWLWVWALVLFGPLVAVWGLPPLPEAWWPAIGAALWASLVFGVVYLLSAVLHELLHAAAMLVVGRVLWRSIRFGVRWREGYAYIHTSEPLTVRAYRVVLAVPGLVLGVPPVLFGWWVGSGWAVAYGYVMIVSAVGDAAMLERLRGFPADARVRDHPSQLGCQVRT